MSQRPYKGSISVFGEYFDLACQLAGLNWADVADQSGVERSTVTKAVRATSLRGRPSRVLVLKWCDLLHPPEDLEESMLHSLGYATRREEEDATASLEQVKNKYKKS